MTPREMIRFIVRYSKGGRLRPERSPLYRDHLACLNSVDAKTFKT